MYDDILVPVDGSAASERAVDHASSLAAAYDASVHLLAVDERLYTTDATTMLAQHVFHTLRPAPDEVLDSASARLPDDVAVETARRAGDPPQTIRSYADAAGIEVIVMCTHGHTGLSRLLLGSTTERTVRLADCPVLAISA